MLLSSGQTTDKLWIYLFIRAIEINLCTTKNGQWAMGNGKGAMGNGKGAMEIGNW
jgi:hypothetical protein